MYFVQARTEKSPTSPKSTDVIQFWEILICSAGPKSECEFVVFFGFRSFYSHQSTGSCLEHQNITLWYPRVCRGSPRTEIGVGWTARAGGAVFWPDLTISDPRGIFIVDFEQLLGDYWPTHYFSLWNGCIWDVFLPVPEKLVNHPPLTQNNKIITSQKTRKIKLFELGETGWGPPFGTGWVHISGTPGILSYGTKMKAWYR